MCLRGASPRTPRPRVGGTCCLCMIDRGRVARALSNNPALRAQIQLGTIGDQMVLLIPEQHDAAVRKQLKKLGYIPRKG
jgi:hypothetical protein